MSARVPLRAAGLSMRVFFGPQPVAAHAITRTSANPTNDDRIRVSFHGSVAGLKLAQQVGDLVVALAGGDSDGRLAVLVAEIRVGAGVEQDPADVQVILLGGEIER